MKPSAIDLTTMTITDTVIRCHTENGEKVSSGTASTLLSADSPVRKGPKICTPQKTVTHSPSTAGVETSTPEDSEYYRDLGEQLNDHGKH